MPHITLDRTQFGDKVHACWIGKNIGGTLGGPWEGRKHTDALTFYEPVARRTGQLHHARTGRGEGLSSRGEHSQVARMRRALGPVCVSVS